MEEIWKTDKIILILLLKTKTLLTRKKVDKKLTKRINKNADKMILAKKTNLILTTNS